MWTALFWTSPVVEFGINSAAELGRLVVSSRDRFGRTIYAISVDLILMKVGDDEMTPSQIYWEPYLIRYPNEEQTISGGLVPIVGLARPVNRTPIIFDLIDEGGQIVGSASNEVAEPSGDLSHTPFELVPSLTKWYESTPFA
jgi:hypothetical protein